MKYTLTVFGILITGYSFAQTTSTPPSETTRLKVTLHQANLTVIFMDQPITITNIQALDSLVKKIPNPERSRIEFESMDADRDQSNSIIRILEKCPCHLVTKSVSKLTSGH